MPKDRRRAKKTTAPMHGRQSIPMRTPFGSGKLTTTLEVNAVVPGPALKIEPDSCREKLPPREPKAIVCESLGVDASTVAGPTEAVADVVWFVIAPTALTVVALKAPPGATFCVTETGLLADPGNVKPGPLVAPSATPKVKVFFGLVGPPVTLPSSDTTAVAGVGEVVRFEVAVKSKPYPSIVPTAWITPSEEDNVVNDTLEATATVGETPLVPDAWVSVKLGPPLSPKESTKSAFDSVGKNHRAAASSAAENFASLILSILLKIHEFMNIGTIRRPPPCSPWPSGRLG